MPLALCLALLSAGKRRLARIAMIAMATSNSTKENATFLLASWGTNQKITEILALANAQLFTRPIHLVNQHLRRTMGISAPPPVSTQARINETTFAPRGIEIIPAGPMRRRPPPLASRGVPADQVP